MAEGDFLAWERELSVPDVTLSPVASPWPQGIGALMAAVAFVRGDTVIYVGPVTWLSQDGEDRSAVASVVTETYSNGFVLLRLPSGEQWGCHHTRVRRLI